MEAQTDRVRLVPMLAAVDDDPTTEGPPVTLCVNLCWLGWPWSGLRWPLVRPGPPRVKDAVRPWGAGFAGP